MTSSGVVVRYGLTVAVRAVNLDLYGGKVVAIMGRNGSGKSSLLWALQGSGPRQAGQVRVAGLDPHDQSSAKVRKLVGLVPQTASDLLYLNTVEAECAAADAESEVDPGTCHALLEHLAPGIDPTKHPETSPKASASPWYWPSNCPPHHPSCCSTNPPEASTTPRKPPLAE